VCSQAAVSRRALVVKNAKDGKTVVVGLAADSGEQVTCSSWVCLGPENGRP
jgi:hypothetical protein